MPPVGPIKRRDLVRALRQFGFEGPYSGGKHQYMVKATHKLYVPNPHSGEISRALMEYILISRQLKYVQNLAPGVAGFLQSLTSDTQEISPSWLDSHLLGQQTVDWLAGHGLAPYAYHQLKTTGRLARLPSDMQVALRAASYRAVADTQLHNRELVAVLAQLAAAGVTPVLFKGAALAHTVYPAPFCRPMGDLDLWLTDEEMPRGWAVLGELGYAQRTKDARPLAMQARRQGEAAFVSSAPGSGLIEFHWGVFAGEWVYRTANIDQAGIRARTKPVTILGQPALTLGPEDAVIQVAVHQAINHQMAYPWLRGLLDVVLLARRDAFDWSALARRAARWRVGVAVWLILDLADQLFGLPNARPAITQLRPSAARRWMLARFATPGTMLARRDLTRTPFRLLFQLLLVDRPGDAVRLVFRTVWPENQWLIDRYGLAGVRVRLGHLSGAMRGQV